MDDKKLLHFNFFNNQYNNLLSTPNKKNAPSLYTSVIAKFVENLTHVGVTPAIRHRDVTSARFRKYQLLCYVTLLTGNGGFSV